MKSNYKKLVLIFIIVIKVPTFIWLLSNNGVNVIDGFWGLSRTELLFGHLVGIENFIDSGVYFPDQRMPGLGLAYLLPKLFFDRATACNILIIFQLLMGIISTYLLAEIAGKIYKNKISFILTAVIYSLCISVSSYDIIIGADSLAVSVSIIGLYYLFKFIETNGVYYIVFSGFLIAWAIFIRPIMGLLWTMIIFYLFISVIKNRSWKAIFPILIFAFPFVLSDSMWIIRNYKKHHEFSPLDSRHLYLTDMNNTKNPFLYPFIDGFVQSWGGNTVMWDPNSEVRWFGVEDRNIDGSNAYTAVGVYTKELPEYIYTSKFNKDSLIVLKNKIQKIWSHTLPSAIEPEYCDDVNKKLLIYTRSIKEEKPFIYYVYAPLRIIKTFIFTHGTQTLINKKFSDMNVLEKALKFLAAFMNILILTAGILGMCLVIIKKKFFGPLFVPISFTLLYVFFIGFVFKFTEIRFLLPLYPFLILTSLYLIEIFKKVKPI